LSLCRFSFLLRVAFSQFGGLAIISSLLPIGPLLFIPYLPLDVPLSLFSFFPNPFLSLLFLLPSVPLFFFSRLLFVVYSSISFFPLLPASSPFPPSLLTSFSTLFFSLPPGPALLFPFPLLKFLFVGSLLFLRHSFLQIFLARFLPLTFAFFLRLFPSCVDLLFL